MTVDIHNLKIAVARELSLHALLFTNRTDYKSVMNEHSHKFSNVVYSQ